MPNIIEKEIARRQARINQKNELAAEIDRLKEARAKAQEEYDAINVDDLQSEIAELEQYLVKEEPVELTEQY